MSGPDQDVDLGEALDLLREHREVDGSDCSCVPVWAGPDGDEHEKLTCWNCRRDSLLSRLRAWLPHRE